MREDHEDLKSTYEYPVHLGATVNCGSEAASLLINPSKKKGHAPNPKDLIGAKKVDISLFPQTALLHGSHAMMNGAKKYNPYNWREYDVEARSYVAAAFRHLQSWLEGEECAEDSGVHHLGHAIACCAILLDAQAENKLIDNRPPSFGGYKKTLEHLNDKIKNESK